VGGGGRGGRGERGERGAVEEAKSIYDCPFLTYPLSPTPYSPFPIFPRQVTKIPAINVKEVMLLFMKIYDSGRNTGLWNYHHQLSTD
jgi:hypothetical protein